MEERDVKRKLATIMVADIVGFSRMTAQDEDWTIRALGEFRGVVDGIIARHDGRIFNTGGDSVLAEFASPVEAVRCAVDFQEVARSRNLLQPRDRQLRFRIGINLGDVMVRGNDLLGDGVNVAARLEGLAEHGGICVSGTVWDHIQGKLSIGYVDIGEQSVKNIPRPIRAYHLRVDGSSEEVAAPLASAALAGPQLAVTAAAPVASKRSVLVPALIAALVIVIIAGGAMVWALWPHERSARIAEDAGRRGNEPASPSTTGTPSVAAQTTTAAPPTLLQALSARLAAVVPALGEQGRESAVREYANSPVHKAQAVSVSPPGFWTAWNFPNTDAAAQVALEGCQVFHGRPCALIAKDDALQPISADGKLPQQDMPRVTYAGNFDPAQIPGISESARRRPDVADYSTHAAPKAVSIHPMRGRLFIISKAASQHAAETEALKTCNDDTVSKGLRGPCFLYAAANRVVLPLRLTEPLTAAPK